MPIEIGDALLKIGVDKKDFDRDMANIGVSVQKALTTTGLAMTAFGAAIVGSLTMATKAAADEQVGIERLTIALRNVGVEYDAVRVSLEGVIAATQRKTGISDSEQRDALGRLLLVTNDYNKALSLLPLTLDLAAAGQMDTSTAATYLGKALVELEGGAEKVSIRLGRATIEFSSLAELMERVRGTAEATANPFDILKNSLSDLTESIGSLLLPVFRAMVDRITLWIDTLKNWIETHPQIAKIITFLTGATGIAALIAGFTALTSVMLLKFIPALVASITALWSFVTAKLAAIAATGYGIPIAIAAATAIGLLAFGINELVKSETAQIEAQQEAAETMGASTEAQNVYGTSVDATTARIQKQIDKQKELSGTMRTAVAEAFLAYAGMGELTASQLEQMRALGELIGIKSPATKAAEYIAGLEPYQHGGLITEPTLLTRVGQSIPYGIMAEKRPEYISPGMPEITLVNNTYLDGDLISTKTERRLMDKVRLQGAK